MTKVARPLKEVVVEKIAAKESVRSASIVEKYGAESIQDLSQEELDALVRTYENPLNYLSSGRNILAKDEKPIFAKVFLTELFENYDAHINGLARQWFDQAIEGYGYSKYSHTVEMGMKFLVRHGVSEDDIALSMINHVLGNVKIYDGQVIHKGRTWHPLQSGGVSKQYDDRVIEVSRYFDHLGVLFPDKGLEEILIHASFMVRSSPHSVANKLNFLEDVVLTRDFYYATPWAALMDYIGSTKKFDELLVNLWRSLRRDIVDTRLAVNLEVWRNVKDVFAKAIDDSVQSARRAGGEDFETKLYREPIFDIVIRAADRDESFANFVYPLVEKHYK